MSVIGTKERLVIKTYRRDKKGLKLIAEDYYDNPIHLDLFSSENNKHRHVLGTNRSGKSILIPLTLDKCFYI